MERRRYKYNEHFLADWMKKNNIPNKEVAFVLGTNNDGINRWTKGDYPIGKDGKKDKTKPMSDIIPMSADKIVALCNHYDIPIMSFFTEISRGGGAEPSTVKDYRFNFGFLAEWMKLNNKTKRDVLNAIGSKDYSGLNGWIAGERPMHIEAILRLCNTYNIPLGCWFFDNNARPDIEPLRPNDTSLTESSLQDRKGKGPRTEAIGVVAEFNSDSKIPEAKESDAHPSGLHDDVGSADTTHSEEVKMLQVQLKYERQISDIKDQHNVQTEEIRRSYEQRLDSRDEIIRSQQEEIMALRRELSEQRRYGGYSSGIISVNAPTRGGVN